MKVFLQFIVSIAVLAVGTVAGVYVEKHNAQESGKTRYLDYKIGTSNLLSTPVIQGKILKVSLDGEPIKQLNRIGVNLSNLSDRDYENIPLYLELYPKEGESFRLVAADATGAKSIPEAIEILNVQPSKRSGAHRVGYKIKTVNRSYDQDESVFTATFLLTGDIPRVQINIDKKGIEAREYSYLSYRNNDTILDSIPEWLWIVVVIIGGVVFLSLLFIMLDKVTKPIEKKQRQRFKDWLKERMSRKDVQDELREPDFNAEMLPELYIKLISEYPWERFKSTPAFIRKFLGVEEPEHLKEKANKAN